MEHVMSRKNDTPTAADRLLHAVAGGNAAPTAEEKVRSVLAGKPGSTTAELALAAGVGKSTAAKILARWQRDGAAVRTPADGPRKPDTWTLAPADTSTAAPEPQDTHPDATPITDSECAPDPDDTAAAGDTEPSPGDDDSSPSETATDAPGTDTRAAADGSGATVDEAARQSTARPPEAQVKDDEPGATPDGTASSGASTGPAATGKERLAKGGLRALVEEYLTEHPGESFGPAQIGKDLVRSGGAVNNALEKLVADGYAIKTCEAPKRFAINPDKTDVPAAPGDTK
jgi:hypothetical protein